MRRFGYLVYTMYVLQGVVTAVKDYSTDKGFCFCESMIGNMQTSAFYKAPYHTQTIIQS